MFSSRDIQRRHRRSGVQLIVLPMAEGTTSEKFTLSERVVGKLLTRGYRAEAF